MEFTPNPRLLNSGVICYMNSSLQCMFYTIPLIRKLHSSTCCKHKLDEFCTLEAFKCFFKSCMLSKHELYPRPFVENLQQISSSLQYGRQEDAHEFMVSLLDRLSECTENKNHIPTIFGGWYVSKLHCFNCCYSSSTTTQELMLVLEISNIKSLEEALKSYTKAEKIEGGCVRCESDKRAKQTKIEKAPEVMFIQLLRFDELHKKVEYPLKLDLKPYMTNQVNMEQTVYDLYAILVHEGSTIDEGHYFSYVRSAEKAWYLKNDSISNEVTEDEVLDQCPYLLFYVKKGFPWFSDMRLKANNKVIGTNVSVKRLVEDLYNWSREALVPPVKRLKNDDDVNDHGEGVNVDAKNL